MVYLVVCIALLLMFIFEGYKIFRNSKYSNWKETQLNNNKYGWY